MPKNKGKGGKRVKRGKGQDVPEGRVPLNDETNHYAWIDKKLGNCRFLATSLTDSVQRMAHMPGKFKKRVYANLGSLVLLQVRPYEDNKADIIYVYTLEEVRKLRRLQEIADTGEEAADDTVVFEEIDLSEHSESSEISLDTL